MPYVFEQGRVQDRGVEAAPHRRAVGADRGFEQVRVGAGEQVEVAVAGEQEGRTRGLVERPQGGGEGAVERAGQERARAGVAVGGQRVQGVGRAQVRQDAMDRADPQRVPDGVHEQYQAAVPRAGAAPSACARSRILA